METDFLMTVLKQQVPSFPNLHIILMSATMQEDIFTQYFNQCPLLYISGIILIIYIPFYIYHI